MLRAPWLHPRALGVAAVALALVLVAALLLPRGGDDRRVGLARPAHAAAHVSLAHAHAGLSPVTAGAAAEIDQVVEQGIVSARRVDARSAPSSLVAAQVRCAVFEGQRYCLHTGWTQRSTRQVVRSASAAVERQARPRYAGRRGHTGDATLLSTLQSEARRTPQAQAAADRAELTQAAESVAKVWLLRHQIQHEALPAGFLADHPEVVVPSRTPATGPALAAIAPAARVDVTSPPTARATAPTTTAPAPAAPPTAAAGTTAAGTTPAATTPAATTSAPTPAAPTTTAVVQPAPPPATSTFKPNSAYPQRARIIDPADTAEQTRTYWCGPTAMQMIAWGWFGAPLSQDVWAQRLGTTSAGTSIASMVAVTNRYTNWDRADYAGPYVVLDVGGFTFRMWWRLLMRHIVDYRAPEILHPILLKQWYPYLDHNESGHFQVGRGYNKRGARSNLIGYFEPFNQQRFDPSEPYIARVQWRGAYKSYRANLDHFQHDIGV